MANIDWAALETDISIDGEFCPPTRESKGKDAKVLKYPCQACGGTGKYRGVRKHQPKSDCFACRGRGYFLTSERDRAAARQQYVANKAKKLAEARAAFDAEYPDITPFLHSVSSWNEFAKELLSKLTLYGSLSEKQVAAIRGLAQKLAERKAARDATRSDAIVDLSPVRAMFESAVSSGHKRPVYRAAGLVISRAPDHGRNPGALYVCDEADHYLGKIIGTQYTPAKAINSDNTPLPDDRTIDRLQVIAGDPRGEAIKYGKRTGTCSCCGRTLTAESSVNAGIGPICASNWGL